MHAYMAARIKLLKAKGETLVTHLGRKIVKIRAHFDQHFRISKLNGVLEPAICSGEVAFEHSHNCLSIGDVLALDVGGELLKNGGSRDSITEPGEVNCPTTLLRGRQPPSPRQRV